MFGEDDDHYDIEETLFKLCKVMLILFGLLCFFVVEDAVCFELFA